MVKKKKNFYAVVKGHTPGIYTSWEQTEKQVNGFSKAEHKGFKTREEAEAFFTAQSASSAPPVHDEADPMPGLGDRLHDMSLDQAQNPEQATHNPIVVYCGISVSGNGTDDARGAYSCVFPEFPTLDIAQPVTKTDGSRVTNQRTYWLAAIRAIEIAKGIPEFDARQLQIITNNEVMKKSMTEWIEHWSKNGWHLMGKSEEVKNLDLIRHIYDKCPWESTAWLHYDHDLGALKYHKCALDRAVTAVPPPKKH